MHRVYIVDHGLFWKTTISTHEEVETWRCRAHQDGSLILVFLHQTSWLEAQWIVTSLYWACNLTTPSSVLRTINTQYIILGSNYHISSQITPRLLPNLGGSCVQFPSTSCIWNKNKNKKNRKKGKSVCQHVNVWKVLWLKGFLIWLLLNSVKKIFAIKMGEV